MIKNNAKTIFLSAAAAFVLAIQAIASPDFEIQKISSDIFAVIRKEVPSLWFNPNTIFIIGKKDVIVIDSNISSEYTKEVFGELKKITSKPVRYVIKRKSVNLEEFRKAFARDSQHKSFIFQNYVFLSATTAAFRQLTEKKSE